MFFKQNKSPHVRDADACGPEPRALVGAPRRDADVPTTPVSSVVDVGFNARPVSAVNGA